MGASCRRVRDGVARGRGTDAVVLRHSAGCAVRGRRRAGITARPGRCGRVLSRLRARVDTVPLGGLSTPRMVIVRDRHARDVPGPCRTDRRVRHRGGGAVWCACALAVTTELAWRASLAEAFGEGGPMGPAAANE